MSQPLVCCLMLTREREEMAMRALACFRSQTYERRRLLVVNSGTGPIIIEETEDAWEPAFVGIDALTVGKIRNTGNRYASHHYVKTVDRPEIFIHWDDDDYSHPNRISEQVALLQSSGKQCVGYRDMLFWNQTEGQFCGAWLYSNPATNYCLGTSLCYWRSVWEARPFPDLPKKKGGTGEDVEWLKGVESLGVLSLRQKAFRSYTSKHPDDCDCGTCGPGQRTVVVGEHDLGVGPRMIASIHGDNTQYYGPDLLGASTSWKRVPEWDQYCRERMAL